MVDKKSVVIVYPKLEPPNPSRRHYLPMPILTLAAPLDEKGYEVILFDGRINNDYKGFLTALKQKPLCFGISAMAGYQIKDGIYISSLIRDQFPDTPIVWGGKFPTILAEETLSDRSVDVVVRGQGEFTFLELLEKLSNGSSFKEIKGISYKEDGKTFHNPDRPITDTDKLPSIPYHLLDMSKYNSVSNGCINYISSYGCPYRCAFCTTTYIYNRKWKGFTAERVLDDLSFLVSKYNIRHVDIQDDLFFGNIDRAKKILQGMIDRKLGLQWITTVRMNQIVRFDREMFQLIKDSGVDVIYSSAESGVQKILDYINKDIKVEHITRSIELFNEYGIPLRTTFLLGSPPETPEDMVETLKFSLNLKEKYKGLEIYFSFYIPVPGTLLFEKAIKDGLIVKPKTLAEWGDFIPIDQSQPWLFIPLHKLQKDKRKRHRIIAFYFWVAYFPKFGEEMRKRGLGLFSGLLKVLAKARFEKRFFLFPVEWFFFKTLFNFKLRIKELKTKNS